MNECGFESFVYFYFVCCIFYVDVNSLTSYKLKNLELAFYDDSYFSYLI